MVIERVVTLLKTPEFAAHVSQHLETGLTCHFECLLVISHILLPRVLRQGWVRYFDWHHVAVGSLYLLVNCKYTDHLPNLDFEILLNLSSHLGIVLEVGLGFWLAALFRSDSPVRCLARKVVLGFGLLSFLWFLRGLTVFVPFLTTHTAANAAWSTGHARAAAFSSWCATFLATWLIAARTFIWSIWRRRRFFLYGMPHFLSLLVLGLPCIVHRSYVTSTDHVVGSSQLNMPKLIFNSRIS